MLKLTTNNIMIRCRRKKILLAALSGGQPVPPTPTPESILAKMLREQPQLYNSLMLWYDPKLQGLTNSQIEDATIGQGYFILRNLQDTAAYNMRVYGMTGEEGDGYINENGELVFDGVDDYSITDNIMRSIPMSLIFSGDVTSDRTGYIFSLANHISMYYQLSNLRWRIAAFGQGAMTINYNTTDNITDVVLISDGRAIINNDVRQLTDGAMVESPAQMRIMTSGTNFANGKLHTFVLFRKNLADDELQWVRDNMINY